MAVSEEVCLLRRMNDAGMGQQAAEAMAFGMKEISKLFRIEVEDVDTLFGKIVADFGQRQRFGKFGVKLGDDRRGCTPGTHEQNPSIDLQGGQPHFGGCGY